MNILVNWHEYFSYIVPKYHDHAVTLVTTIQMNSCFRIGAAISYLVTISLFVYICDKQHFESNLQYFASSDKITELCSIVFKMISLPSTDVYLFDFIEI